jgi:hypothetical protein
MDAQFNAHPAAQWNRPTSHTAIVVAPGPVC